MWRSSPDSRTLTSPERQGRAALTLCWPAALGAAPFMLSLGDIPLCAFRQLTGRPCPLCGGTHACAALVEGDFMAAWQANPGLMPLLVIAAAHTVQLAYEAWAGRRIGQAWRIGSGLWGIGGAALVLAWVLRLFGQL